MFARSSCVRTIRPTEAGIARADFTRSNGSGARESRGGRGAATAPSGERVRRLKNFCKRGCHNSKMTHMGVIKRWK
jgi:hypothetical protein